MIYGGIGFNESKLVTVDEGTEIEGAPLALLWFSSASAPAEFTRFRIGAKLTEYVLHTYPGVYNQANVYVIIALLRTP